MSDASSAAPAAPVSAAPAASESSAPIGDFDASAGEPSVEDVEAAIEQAPEEVKKELRKKYNLKVNGKSRDIELDLGNDEEVQRYLQKAMASDEKFQEAAHLRKSVESLVAELKSNPLAILRHPELGIDVRKLAEQVLTEEIEQLSKSPEQKRIEEMEQKLKDFEEERKTLEQQKKEAEYAKLEQQAFQQLDDQISDALSKTTLPKSPYVVKRIADAMIEAVNLGYNDVTADQIMPYVEEQITGEIQRLFEESPDEVLERLVNKKRLDQYRKSKVKKAQQKQVVSTKQIQDTGITSKTADKKPTSELRVKDLFKLT